MSDNEFREVLDTEYIVCEEGDRIAAVQVLCSMGMALCAHEIHTPDDEGGCDVKTGVMYALQTLGVDFAEFATALGLLGAVTV